MNATLKKNLLTFALCLSMGLFGYGAAYAADVPVLPETCAGAIGCDGVCGSGKAVDACGVCGGSGLNASGCCGTQVKDACGACGGGGLNPRTGCCGTLVKGCDGVCGSGKIRGCDGVCAGTKRVDACGVCGGSGVNPTTGCCGTLTKGCDGICGSGAIRGCDGVCGSGKVIGGCDNKCGSTKTVDQCGVCGGPGPNTIGCCGNQTKGCDGVCGSGKVIGGCDNQCGSTKKLDACGVCGGSGVNPVTGCCGTLIKGCDGVCGSGKSAGCDGVCGSGKKVDACGVCGGAGINPATGCCGAQVKGCDGVCGSGKVIGGCDKTCGSTKTVDPCGVCGGSGVNATTGCCGAQVKGCDGVCGSGKKVDACGVCGGAGINPATGCCGSLVKGCDGVCGSGAVKGCDGVCASGKVIGGCDNTCGSTKTVDQCGVCGGAGIKPATGCCGSLVKGCDGVCGSGTVKGCDGVCASGKVIGGCDNTCGSTKTVDQCGVCGGSGLNSVTGCCGTQVKGCDGICASGKVVGCDGICGSGKVVGGCDQRCGSTKTVDVCGVCAGSGKLKDNNNHLCCKLAANGCCPTFGKDTCGVCGGTGTYFTVSMRNWHSEWEDHRGWWRAWGTGGATSCLQQIAEECGMPEQNVAGKNTSDELVCIREKMGFTNQSDCENKYRPTHTNVQIENIDGSDNCYRQDTRYLDKNCNATGEPPDGTACAGTNTLWTFNSPISLVWDEKAGEALTKERHVAEFVLKPGDDARYADWRGSAAWPLLVHDPDGKGEVRDGTQLFGESTFGRNWTSGYEALGSLDANKDGKVAGSELKGLALWFDENRNGKSETGEVKSLESQSVTALYFNDAARRPNTVADLELKVGYERKLNGKTVKGRSIDWYGQVYNEKTAAQSPASAPDASAVATQPLGPVSGLWFWQTKEQVEGARWGGVLALQQHGKELLGESYTERPVDENGTGITALATASALRGKVEASELRFTVAGNEGLGTVTTAKLSADGKRLEGETIEERRRTDSGETYARRYTWFAERANTLKR